MSYDESKRKFLQVLVWLSFVLLTTTPADGQQAPSADAGFPSTGPISGYMDFHFNKADGAGRASSTSTDSSCSEPLASRPGSASSASSSSNTRSSKGSKRRGELELEQAYLDFLLSTRVQRACRHAADADRHHQRAARAAGVQRRRASVRRHRDRSDDLVRRRRRRARRGRSRAGATARTSIAPLNALEFTADEGIRGGRQKGAEANVRNIAFTGRLEYRRRPRPDARRQRLDAASRASTTPRLDTTVTVGESDARYRRRAARAARPVRAGSTSATPRALNDSDRPHYRRVSRTSPRPLRGFYGEGAYRVWNGGLARDLVGFVRYENFDTQFRMPDGFLPLEEFDRDAWVVGADLLPRSRRRREDRLHLRCATRAASFPHRDLFNVGLGWWF